MSILSVPTFCIVTGGNRGVGRAIATQLARKLGPDSTLYLIDRDPMEETARDIEEKAGGNLKVKCIKVDLTDEGGLAEMNRSLFENVEASKFESAILVHNVGTVDMSGYARDLDDAKYLQKHNLLNISGPIVMTSEFLKVFGAPGTELRKTIVNISTEASWMPLKTMHYYGAYKAARNMFYRVMALEEPELRILTFTPGSVDTPGFHQMQFSVDSEIRATYEKINKWGGLLQPEQSADALVKTLEEDKYENAVVVRCLEVLGVKYPTEK